MTQIPLTTALAATVYKLQGKTYKAILPYDIHERGRQYKSLYVMSSCVTELRSLFLYKKLTHEDYQFFRQPQKVFEEEKRLELESEKTLQKYHLGLLHPEARNKNIAGKNLFKLKK